MTLLRLATALRLSPAQVEALLLAAGLMVGPDGTIDLPAGPHQISLDEETFAMAGCALDTLLFPRLFEREARVVSPCPATGRQIRLTVTEQGTRDLGPASAVVSLRLPDETTTAGNAEETICAYGHFFVDREHALSWPDLHPEAVLLSVADAARVAREIANVSRGYAEQGES